MAQNATGNAIQSAYTGVSATVLEPSGVTSGGPDSTAIQNAAVTGAHVVLAAGNWYLSGATISNNNTWIQGSGAGTIINIPAGDTGFTISGVSQFEMSDMSFSLGTGSTGIQVNGMSDSHCHDMWFSGSAATAGVSVNGDDATEQHWSDCMFRNVGGVNFAYTRTTATDTGGMYLDRMRCVSPPSGATGGFSFKSTSGSVTPANLFLDQCVADSFFNDCYLFSNISNTRVSDCWAGLNAGANSGKVPIHVTGGFDQAIGHCYTFQPLNGFCILIDGGGHEIQIGNQTVFDGAGGATALGLSAAGGNFRLGNYYSYVGTLTDTPTVLSNNVGAVSPGTFQTNGGGGTNQVLGIDDVSHPGNQIWLRNNAGALQLINTAYSSELGEFDQDGGAYFLLYGNQSGNRFSQGSGAPSKPAGVNPASGDLYFRTDTPGTANQRIYVCTVGGGTPTWVGIV